MKKLKATYDKKALAAYIYMGDAKEGEIKNTRVIDSLVHIDYNKDGIMVGMEVLLMADPNKVIK